VGRFVGHGKSVKVTASAAVNQGDFVLAGGFFGLAVNSAGAGEEVVLNIEQGEYETSQITTADAFNAGDPVYWDDTNKKLTTEAGSGNRLVGRVTVAKDANNVIWFMLGPQV
jgi:predicted RecA/RadA family phage recombinase